MCDFRLLFSRSGAGASYDRIQSYAAACQSWKRANLAGVVLDAVRGSQSDQGPEGTLDVPRAHAQSSPHSVMSTLSLLGSVFSIFRTVSIDD
jgi:hypothetical protein